MKKVISAALLCLMLLGCIGCDHSGKLKQIETRSVYSQQNLRLGISSPKAERGGIPNGHLNFESKQSLAEMKAVADECKTAYGLDKVELSEKSVFISRQGLIQGTKDYYIIQKAEDSEKNYNFSGSDIRLVYDVSGREIKILELLFPLQYMKNSYHYTSENLYTQQTYEATKGINDFFQYYEDSGWFKVEKDDACVTILGFKENLCPSNANQQLPGIKFTFSENGEQIIFTMSVE